jgi:thermitase
MTVGLLAGGLALSGSPAPVLAADRTDAVSLVVGLRDAGDVVSTLERHTDVDVVASKPMAGSVTVDVPADQATQATAALRADPAVSYVEPNYLAQMSAFTPADPSFAGQWGIVKTGVNAVWNTTTGSSSVIVAVVDTGVAAVPDLAGRLLPGKDFVNHDNNAADDNGHGTMAAGVIAARGGNHVGIAGICWECRILPVKVLDSHGSGTYTDIAAGIRYAADAGADIISLSLGGSADGQVLRDAVSYAVGKGALVIGAAGNDGGSALHYPAAIPSVLAVGGSTDKDARYSWSNWGRNWVDIAAPGCNPAQQINGVVGQYCGTSSATPFTAGVAALLASTSPKPSADTIRIALMSSAHKLSGNWIATASGRVDAAAALAALPGTGQATVARRVAAKDHTPPSVTVTKALANQTRHVRGTAYVSVTGSDRSGMRRLELLVNGKVIAGYAGGSHRFSVPTWKFGRSMTVRVRGYDTAGNVRNTPARTWYR